LLFYTQVLKDFEHEMEIATNCCGQRAPLAHTPCGRFPPARYFIVEAQELSKIPSGHTLAHNPFLVSKIEAQEWPASEFFGV
jgi:hypothetical protein